MVDDAIDHRIVGDESDDAHFSLAFGADQGVDLVNLADHPGPTAAGDLRAFLLDAQELRQALLSLAHLPPMSIGIKAEVTEEGLDGRLAELAQKPALILEEDAQHPGDGEDDLAVRHIQEELLPHPLAPFLKAFGMTGGAKSAAAAGKVKEPFLATIRTPDAGKTTLRIAAVEIALYHFLDDRSKIPVLLLESRLIP